MSHRGQTTEMNEDKEFLRTEPLGQLLLKLALPTVAAQLINMLYNIVDRIYIGHIPDIGATALTGVGVCMPLIMIVSAFAALVGYGGAPRASIFMGKQDKESAEKTLGNCFVLQILISVVLTIVLLIWNQDFLMAFGASENTIEYGVNYMNIYALGTIFVMEDQAYFGIFGTKGILFLTDPNQFGGEVRFLPKGDGLKNRPEVQLLKTVNPYNDNSRGIGPWDMADTILNGTPLRASGEMAYHVHEVLNAMLEGGTAGAFRDISSVCQRPEPLVEG